MLIDGCLFGRHIRIRAMALLFAIMVTVILASLGGWQVVRAKHKRVLLAKFSRARKSAAQIFSTDKRYPDYQRVTLRGRFLNAKSFLLDNKFHRRKIGYQVITPFKLLKSHSIVLINRGWLAAKRNRKQLPVLIAVTGQQSITGRVYQPHKKIMVFKMLEDNPGVWPRVMERFDASAMSKALGFDVYPHMIWLDADVAHGFVREWRPLTLPPMRHIAYAVQWFMLMITFVIGFIALHSEPVTRQTRIH